MSQQIGRVALLSGDTLSFLSVLFWRDMQIIFTTHQIKSVYLSTSTSNKKAVQNDLRIYWPNGSDG